MYRLDFKSAQRRLTYAIAATTTDKLGRELPEPVRAGWLGRLSLSHAMVMAAGFEGHSEEGKR